MTQISASDQVAPECRIPPAAGHPALAPANITIDPALTRSTTRLFLGVGAVGIGLAIAGGFVVSGKHALAALLVGNMAVLTVCAVAMILTMAFHLVNAGWWGGFRRQIENIATLTPVFGATAVVLTAVDYFALHGSLWTWMGTKFAATDLAYLLEKKAPYLNVPFFFGRTALYVVIWAILTQMLFRLSRRADTQADPALAAKARFMSAWGILIGALTIAFASFDWIMGLDFRFFSTMFPVKFFAAGAFACVAVLVLVLVLLRGRGKLQGVIGPEHFHDLGKLMFAFTVFWAYISYFEYFLYWYGNIPEETAYFTARSTGAWKPIFYFLCFGHFVVPFLILIFRGVKRSPRLLAAVAVWAVFIHVADMVFLVRPMVYAGVPADQNPGMGAVWIDAAGAVGVLAVFGGLLARKIGSGPLVGVNDPRMTESLEHKNYV